MWYIPNASYSPIIWNVSTFAMPSIHQFWIQENCTNITITLTGDARGISRKILPYYFLELTLNSHVFARIVSTISVPIIIDTSGTNRVNFTVIMISLEALVFQVKSIILDGLI